MSMMTSVPVDEIRLRGTIRESDVERLRVAYGEADAITPEDAQALVGLHSGCPVQAPSWSDFYIEAITDYVVHQASPEGYVVAENARWLIESIAPFGHVETSTELSLLVHVLETARWSPPSLAAFGLAQVKHAVATGAGPLRAGRPVEPGIILAGEVEMAARLIRAFGRDTAIPVTRAEACELIAINRAIAPGHSSPAWSELFIRCVGSAVLAALAHAVPPRDELFMRHAGPASPAEIIALFGNRESHRAGSNDGGSLQVWASLPLMSSEQRALARLERQRHEIVSNEVIEDATDVWLMSRLGDVRGLDDNELALLSHISREASRVPPGLAEFASRAMIAA